MIKMDEVHVVGRRKSATARVHLFSGKGTDMIINKKPYSEYLMDRKDLIREISSPFEIIGRENEYLIKINVKGGGKSGQTGAIRLGISRALAQLDEGSRKLLRSAGFLTRDSRVVERKKPGKHKARKSTQYSKR
ncbi:30S ribosomal protein S9 [Elusimicrobiota bacterium]